MTTPFATETPLRLEPVAHDPFIDDLVPPRSPLDDGILTPAYPAAWRFAPHLVEHVAA